MRLLITSLAVCVITAFAACAPKVVPKVGSPDTVSLELPDLHGRAQGLEDYSGKYVLLHFWASWCIPCTYELAHLQNLADQLRSDNLVVLAVAVQDEWDPVQQIVRDRHVRFPVLLDQRGSTRESFGLSGLPRTLLIDPAGRRISLIDPANLRSVDMVDGARPWDRPEAVDALRRLIRTK